MVRAKFRITKHELTETTVPGPVVDGKQTWVPGTVTSLRMQPVYGNGDPTHENTKFWHATPSGEILLGCVNAEAAAQFAIGHEVYVDFTVLPRA